MNTRFSFIGRVALLVTLLLALALPQIAAAANTIVTPANPDGWAPTDVRTDATVGITADQPRSGLGSLKFTTNTVTPSQDKADFTKTWTIPSRTLGALSDVSYEFYRDSSSTTAAHFAPVLRLMFWQDNAPAGAGAEDHTGYLIWEQIYNGYNPVPTNVWHTPNLTTQYFWMRLVTGPNSVGCNKTIQNFSVTLNDWKTTVPTGQPGDCAAPDFTTASPVYIYGINTGVGSGWGNTFMGYVDNVVVAFGADVVSANFEPNPVCTTICYVDTVNGSDTTNGGTSAADAFKTIQKGIDTVQPGGEVRVLPGTYPESPNVNKSVTLVGVNGRNQTTIDLQSGPTYLGSLTISGADVTVEGFTIEGFDAVGAGLANTNVQLTNAPDDVLLKNNRIKVGQVGSGSNGDDGIGLLTAYNTSSDVGLLRVEGNEFMPLNTSAFRAFYINPGVDVFEFVGNTFTGNFTASSYTQAKDGLVENNTLTGTGTSRGLGTWGYPDPTVYGATLFQGNTISDVVNGISILGSENVTVRKNIFTGNDRAVYVAEDDPFDLSTIHINRNSIDGNTMGIENWYQTEIDGTCNWWGDASGPGPVGPGSGDPVSANVDYSPWLYTSNLDGPCYVGGTISIDKVAAGAGALEFEFDVSWSNSNVKLTDAAPPYVTAPPLPAGNYTITEVNLPLYWVPVSASCDNTVTTPVETVNPANITVADGNAWVCTFTNRYAPGNTCPVGAASNEWTDLLGIGMGSTKAHKMQAKLVIPNNTNLVELYGQLVAKNTGLAKYVRFIQPGKNNFVEVNTITSPANNINGNFWYGANLPVTAATKWVTGKWWLQQSGVKNHMPRAFVLYPTYRDTANNYVNVWDTYHASEGEVYWDVAQGWTPVRELHVPIAAPLGATALHVEIALVDNDKDARPVWVTVTAGNVTQTQKPTGPNKGNLLNLLVFDLANVPAGTSEIVVRVYSPAPYAETGVGALGGDSAAVVGLAANYRCAPITTP